MAEFNLDDVDPHRQEVVVLQTIQPHHALIKANRFLLHLVYALIAIVFILGFVLLPRQGGVLENIGRSQTVAATQNPVLTAEINTLKGQMFGLVSGSIDSTLKSLEDNIRRGSLAESLETLQELKSDVKIRQSGTGHCRPESHQRIIRAQRPGLPDHCLLRPDDCRSGGSVVTSSLPPYPSVQTQSLSVPRRLIASLVVRFQSL